MTLDIPHPRRGTSQPSTTIGRVGGRVPLATNPHAGGAPAHHRASASILPKLPTLLLTSLFSILFSPLSATTLTYQSTNKWPAPNHPPLLTLMEKTRQGTTHFTVTLPATGRPLSIQRLHILSEILTKQAPKPPLTFTETTATAPTPNTLILTPQ